MFPGVYTLKEERPRFAQRIVGAWMWSGQRGVVAGLAAAALHGARVQDSPEVELIWRCGRPPAGITVRNERIQADEVVEISGMPVTTPERTALDLARHAARDPAVICLDALARATGVTTADVEPLVDRYRGARGLRRAIVALRLMDGGLSSARQSSVRLALVDAGFPTPRTDFTVGGKVRLAMGYEAPRVGVLFGSDSPELFAPEGWMLIPASDSTPRAIAGRMRMAVIERGYPLWRLQRLERVAGRRT
jgi:hypothetical protein